MASDADANECLFCHEVFPKDESFLTCVDCEFSYHFGECSETNTTKAKNAAAKKSWTCPTCRIAKTRGGQEQEKSKQSKETKDHEDGNLLAQINKKLAALMEMKSTVENIEKKVQSVSDQYDGLLAEMRSQRQEITYLKERIEKVENADNKETTQLKRKINDLEQYSRQQNLEIHGLPWTVNENLLEKLNDLALELDLPPLSEQELEGLHRLPTKPEKTPVVLLRFFSRATRDRWLQKKGQLRGNKPQIYENLTAQNKRLLWLVKAEAKANNYQYTWQKNGKIFVRKKTGDCAIRINSEDELAKIS